MGSKRRPTALRSVPGGKSTGNKIHAAQTHASTRTPSPPVQASFLADHLSVDRIALIDKAGNILSTTAAWNDFLKEGVIARRRIGVGANYFDICRQSARTSREATVASKGVRSVLRRNLDSFRMEYTTRVGSETKHFLMTVLPLELGEVCACIIQSDITALKSAKSIAEAIFNSPSIPVAIRHSDGHVASANEAFLRLIRHSREELDSGQIDLNALTPSEFASLDRVAAIRTRSLGKYALVEKEYELGDGTRVPVLLCECRLADTSEDRIAFVTDRSVQSSTEIALERSQSALKQCTQELKALTHRVLIVQEEERRRIARELHDDVNGHIGMMAFEIRQSTEDSATSTSDLRGHLKRVLDQIIELSGRVRTISHRLHSPILEHAGLVVALQSLFDEAHAKLQLMVRFTTSGDLTRLSREAVECVYRVAQECVQNIALHARVKEATAQLYAEASQIVFTIADRGVGFDVKADSTGLGLLSMKERVCIVGGVLEIRSKAGSGTRIRLTLPRQEATPAET